MVDRSRQLFYVKKGAQGFEQFSSKLYFVIQYSMRIYVVEDDP